jgi:L-amino acid N-acyltransferase YncA
MPVHRRPGGTVEQMSGGTRPTAASARLSRLGVVADVSVRPATAADVEEIARIQRETWQQAYAAWLPPVVLESVTPAVAEATWRAAVCAPPTPRHHVVVALEQDFRVGFAAFGPAVEDAGGDTGGDAPAGAGAGVPGAGQVEALLVEPRWGRRGHGSRLLAAAVDLMRADGVRVATVWLPDQDAASVAFFTSAGWERDGYARTLESDGASMTEIRLHVSLEE